MKHRFFNRPRFMMTSVRTIALAFAVLIGIGCLLLCLPVSSVERQVTPITDALFTATSAACVTGLAVRVTAGYWSLFGKIVILCLIQIGGLGIMTLITVFASLSKKNLSINERKLVMASAGALSLGGLKSLLYKVISGTLIFELAGAVLLSIRFCRDFGIGRGIWYSVFHSVSAFCNAGFDIIGETSVSAYSSDPLVMITLMALISVGGIGFFVWTDVQKYRFRLRKYSLHSKIVLISSLVLTAAGAVIFYVTEGTGAFSGMNAGERILNSFFQSVTCRTAGFFAVPQSTLSGAGTAVSVLLMLVGGSPGSTAGGIKTTTIVLLAANVFACAGNKQSVVIGRHKVDDLLSRQASAVCAVYAAIISMSAVTILAIEKSSFSATIFECVSAMCTVGLTAEFTSSLCTASHIILILLMYVGRIGGLSILLALAENREKPPIDRPTESFLVG